MEHCIMIDVDAGQRRKELLRGKLSSLVKDGVEVIVLYSFARGCFFIRLRKVGPDCEVIQDLFTRGFEFCATSEAMKPGLHPVLLDQFASYNPSPSVQH